MIEIRQKKCSTNFKYTLHRYSVDDKPIALLTVNFRTGTKNLIAESICTGYISHSQ